MLALAIALAAAAFGWGAVRRLGDALAAGERAALAVGLASAAAPWVLLAAVAASGYTVGLPLGAAVLGLAGWALGRGAPRGGDGPAAPAASTLSLVVLGGLLALLFHGHMLHREASGLWTGGTTYGDLALHTTLVSHFAATDLSLASPITAGESLTYPFLGDFMVACLVRGGWSLSTAFAVTGWLSAFAGLMLIEAVARRCFQARAAGTIAVWLVVLSGALIGVWHAGSDLWHHGLPRDPARLPSYANQWDRGVTWSNIVCDFLLPQRALLAGFPIIWGAALLLRTALDERRRPGALAVVGALIGALPLIHTHAFLIGAGVLGLATLVDRLARPRVARRLGWTPLMIAAAVAAPQLAWQFSQTWGGDFGHVRLGWRAPHGQFWTYWLRNWGLPLALAPLAAVFAWRRRRSADALFPLVLVLGAAAVFAVGNVYQFQPHDWDNMKLFVYAHMALAVVLGGALARALAGGRARRALTALALVGMTTTGALTIARELDVHDQLASADDLKLAARLRAVLPADALVLTSDQHNHVVPMLTGRRIVMGYRGWLWTHGLDVRQLERDVRAMFAGGPALRPLAARYGVTHVYIGPGEERDWGADRAWFRAAYRVVLEANGVMVVDLRLPRAPRLARR